MKSTLHITNWYPHPGREGEAPYIKNTIGLVAGFFDSEVWHVQVRQGRALLHYRHGRLSATEKFLIIETRLTWSRLIELLSTALVFGALFFAKAWRFDLVAFHIAYPNLRFVGLVKRLIRGPIVIFEHWSAYHRDFGIPGNRAALRRIGNVFSGGIPVVAVSGALAQDIRRFAGRDDFEIHVVPNAVFHAPLAPDNNFLVGEYLVMIAHWGSPIKRPELAIGAFASVSAQYPELRLKIIGDGTTVPEMMRLCEVLGIRPRVDFLGALGPEQVANILRSAKVFLHASTYETFSIVCAEAICSGVPVLASSVGAIPEVVSSECGCLVENRQEDWNQALRGLLGSLDSFDRGVIASTGFRRFSPQRVGPLLAGLLTRLIGGGRR